MTPRAGSSDDGYVESWRQINELLRRGRGFSGRERNCCFLNTGDGRFADVSSISGFDLADDGRGMAVGDWDRDGDLDVWVTNRAAPRVRFLRNDLSRGGNFVSLRLVGTAERCNRDAIGARVELTLADSAATVLRTVRAGEGYLSQSSKWLHFGLGKAASIGKLAVHWPSGETESFEPPAANQRYLLVQGSGRCQPQSVGTFAAAKPQQMKRRAPLPGLQTQNLLTQRVPLPPLPYTTIDGRESDASRPEGKPLLINLWSATCQPCIEEMAELSKRKEELAQNGIDVALLCVDELNSAAGTESLHIQEFVEQLKIPFAVGMATTDFVEKLQITHDVLYDHHRPLPIPTSLLIDAHGALSALYKGPVSVDRILRDVSRLDLSGDELLATALPAAGYWIAQPGPHRFAEFVDTLHSQGYADDAMALAVRLDTATGNGRQQASLKTKAARGLARQGDFTGAMRELNEALRLDPTSAVAHMELGTIYGRQNDLPSAVRHLSEAVRLDDQGLPDAYLNLGVALRRMGRLDEAVRCLERALAIDSMLAPAHVNLALIRGGQGRMDEAAAHFREAIRLDPSDVPTRINLAVALMKQRRHEEALRELQVVLKSQPNLPLALTYASEILSGLGRRAEAIEMLRGTVAQQPQIAPLRFLLGRHLQEEGHTAEALEQYRECERLDRGNVQALIRIAWIQSTSPDEQLRDGDNAVRLATRAVAITNRRDIGALDALAAAYAETGQFENAITTAQVAVTLAQRAGQASFVKSIQSRLQRYRRRKPVRSFF